MSLETPPFLRAALFDALPHLANEVTWYLHLRDLVGRALYLTGIFTDERRDFFAQMAIMRSDGLTVPRADCLAQLSSLDEALLCRVTDGSRRAMVRQLRHQVGIFARWLGIPTLPRASWHSTEIMDDGSLHAPVRGRDHQPRRRRAPAASRVEQRLA
ncbi:MAG: hypothetical protein JOZ69_02930, partial [Myxococcales bacterium]|nr:hypothetical protein [Myxococcales bacterium]